LVFDIGGLRRSRCRAEGADDECTERRPGAAFMALHVISPSVGIVVVRVSVVRVRRRDYTLLAACCTAASQLRCCGQRSETTGYAIQPGNKKGAPCTNQSSGCVSQRVFWVSQRGSGLPIRLQPARARCTTVLRRPAKPRRPMRG